MKLTFLIILSKIQKFHVMVISLYVEIGIEQEEVLLQIREDLNFNIVRDELSVNDLETIAIEVKRPFHVQ